MEFDLTANATLELAARNYVWRIVEKGYAQFVTLCESFLVIAPDPTAYDPAHKYKTTHLIVESVEMPGILSDILSAFEMPNVTDAENDREVLMR